MAFDGGIAFGVDRALIPLGFGGNCDEINETRITVNVFHSPLDIGSFTETTCLTFC